MKIDVLKDAFCVKTLNKYCKDVMPKSFLLLGIDMNSEKKIITFTIAIESEIHTVLIRFQDLPLIFEKKVYNETDEISLELFTMALLYSHEPFYKVLAKAKEDGLTDLDRLLRIIV